MLDRLRAALACLQGKGVVFNTHTTGMTFVKNPDVFHHNTVTTPRA